MDKYQETHESWNKVAKAYEQGFMHLDLYNSSYDALCDLLPLSAHVLETGCGPGNITHYLHRKRPDLKLLGTDISEEMLRLAKENVPAAEFRKLDIRNLHRIEKTFGAIVAGFCIPYISPADLEECIRSWSHHLSPGGYLYLSYVPGDTQMSGYITGNTGHRMYFYYYTPDFIHTLLLKHGFHSMWNGEVIFERKNDEKEIHAILIAQYINT